MLWRNEWESSASRKVVSAQDLPFKLFVVSRCFSRDCLSFWITFSHDCPSLGDKRSAAGFIDVYAASLPPTIDDIFGDGFAGIP